MSCCDQRIISQEVCKISIKKLKNTLVYLLPHTPWVNELKVLMFYPWQCYVANNLVLQQTVGQWLGVRQCLVQKIELQGPFYKHRLTSIPAWISNHMPCKVCDRITYPFTNFKSYMVEVWEWISNFIPHFIITYLCRDLSQFRFVKKGSIAYTLELYIWCSNFWRQ